MFKELKNNFILLSQEREICEFVNYNNGTLKIISAIKPHLISYFPHNKFYLNFFDDLDWTTETKQLLNVHVDEEMSF